MKSKNNREHPRKIALLGFGEAAQAFAKGWRQSGYDPSLLAFDIKTSDPSEKVVSEKLAEYQRAFVTGAQDLATLLETTNICFSLVTADQAFSAAEQATRFIHPGTYFLDANSCAPETKRKSAALIENAGAHYVDMAIMAPVHPGLIATPSLLSGSHSHKAEELLGGLGMNAKSVKGDIGHASAIKMIRSVMIKGMESLTAECILAARKAGVEDYIVDSLSAGAGTRNWQEQASYSLERMMVHGQRRAAEMREVVKTIEALGLSGAMSRATVDWQQAIGDLELEAGADNLLARTDEILARLGQ